MKITPIEVVEPSVSIDVCTIVSPCRHETRLATTQGNIRVTSDCQPRRNPPGSAVVRVEFFLDGYAESLGGLSLYAMNEEFDFNQLYMAWLEFEILFGEKGRTSGFWWLDDFRKNSENPKAKSLILSAIAGAYFKAESNGIYRSIPGFYVFPAAYGPSSETLRLKIVAHYVKYMGCENVPGARYLKYLPLFRRSSTLEAAK